MPDTDHPPNGTEPVSTRPRPSRRARLRLIGVVAALAVVL